MKIYDILKGVSKKYERTDTDVVKDKCTDEYGRNVTTCVSCGDIIPEGSQVCTACMAKVNNK